jgi:hypothetical protein
MAFMGLRGRLHGESGEQRKMTQTKIHDASYGGNRVECRVQSASGTPRSQSARNPDLPP